jgi:uncharacterized protein (DUF2147 family)
MTPPALCQRRPARQRRTALIALACACVALVCPWGQAPGYAAELTPADAIVGLWKPVDRDITVKIERTGGNFTGTVSASGEPAQVGRVILRGLEFNEAERLYRGEVFAAKRGVFVPARIRMTDAKTFRLTAGSGLFSREVEWQRK